jgi:hypothetical protein
MRCASPDSPIRHQTFADAFDGFAAELRRLRHDGKRPRPGARA